MFLALCPPIAQLVDPPAGGLLSKCPMCFTYAIYNEERDKIYIGHTTDLANRLERHNGVGRSKSTSFTKKNKGIWELLYSEEFDTREKAIKRERELKSFRGREFIRNLVKRR